MSTEPVTILELQELSKKVDKLVKEFLGTVTKENKFVTLREQDYITV